MYVEEREGREAGYDNGIDQINIMGDSARAYLDYSDGLSHLGLCLKGRSFQEGNDRPLYSYRVSAPHAPDRGSRHHVSFALIFPVNPYGVDAAKPSYGSPK